MKEIEEFICPICEESLDNNLKIIKNVTIINMCYIDKETREIECDYEKDSVEEEESIEVHCCSCDNDITSYIDDMELYYM